jgi:DNA-binding IclR family transcriptional regulator
MACISPDGTLSESGRRILAALEHDSTPEGVARATALPLFRVRSALRELETARLVRREGSHFKVAG